MNLDIVFMVSLSLGCVAVLLVVLAQWSIHKELRVAHKEISRFPLFKTRDSLIRRTEQADIVERLRDMSEAFCDELGDDDYMRVDTLEAADEIERLRARVEELEDTIVALRRIAAEGDKASPYREARKHLGLDEDGEG